jgi:hypothetical protein
MIPLELEPFKTEVIGSNRNKIYFPYWTKRVYALQVGSVYYIDSPESHPFCLRLVDSRKCRFGELTVTEFLKGFEFESDDQMIAFEFERVPNQYHQNGK